jgi:hypothetical protein
MVPLKRRGWIDVSPTPFKQGGDGGRFSGIKTTTDKARATNARAIYVGGDNYDDNGCVWVQIGTSDEDLGIEDSEDGVAVVYMSLDDAAGLALELLSRVRKVKAQKDGKE